MQSTDPRGSVGEGLSYEERGTPGAPRLVLIHGFTQSALSWEPIVTQLSDRFEIIAVDLPGHRGSDVNRAPDLDTTAALVGAVGGQAIYCGYSLGGRVALTLACQSPSLVRALVLVSTSPGIADSTERARRRQADERLAERLSPRDGGAPELTLDQFLDEWLALPLFAHLDKPTSDRESRGQNTLSGLAHSLRSAGLGSMRPLFEHIGACTMPVRCLAGARDERYATIAREMAAAMGTGARAHIIEGVGHALPFEAPQALVRVLDEIRVAISP